MGANYVNGVLQGFVSKWKITSDNLTIVDGECHISVQLPPTGSKIIQIELSPDIKEGTEISFKDSNGHISAPERKIEIFSDGSTIDNLDRYYLNKAQFEGVKLKKTKGGNWEVLGTINRPSALQFTVSGDGNLEADQLKGVQKIHAYSLQGTWNNSIPSIDPSTGITDIFMDDGQTITLFI